MKRYRLAAFVVIILSLHSPDAGALSAGNLVVNPSAEGGPPTCVNNVLPPGWTEYSFGSNPQGTVCGVSNLSAHSLLGYIHLETANCCGSYAGVLSSPQAVLPSTRVYGSVFTRSFTNSTVGLHLQFYGSSGQPVLPLPGGAEVAGPTWLLQEVSATAPATATAVQLLVYACASCGGSFDVDDASLYVHF